MDGFDKKAWWLLGSLVIVIGLAGYVIFSGKSGFLSDSNLERKFGGLDEEGRAAPPALNKIIYLEEYEELGKEAVEKKDLQVSVKGEVLELSNEEIKIKTESGTEVVVLTQ